MEFVGSLVIDSKEYGRLITYPSDDCRIGNLYYVTTDKDNKKLAGVVTKNGEEIIKLQEIELVEEFHTQKNKDICLGFKRNNSKIKDYYHLKKIDNTYKISMKIDGEAEIPINVIPIEDCNKYWMFEAQNQERERAVYRLEDCKLITNFFSEITVLDEENNPYHEFYFNKDIYIDVPLDEEDENSDRMNILVTSLKGFLDENGNFSSQIVDTDLDKDNVGIYDSSLFGRNTLSKQFHEKVTQIKNYYLKRYNEHEDKVDYVLEYLFSNPDLSESKIKKTKGPKILEFKPRKKV